jgi:hypothetical protein
MSLILSGTEGVGDVDGSAATPAIRGTDTNTGIFFPAADTIAFAEGGAEIARFDSAGNMGLGVTPSASTLRMLQGPNAEFVVAARYPYVASNAIYNVAWKYTNTEAASLYIQAAGQHIWQNAPSGTAGNAITFTQAMTLDASGNLLVGTTTGGDKLVVEQAAAASASLFKNSSGTATAQCAVAWHANTAGDNVFHQFFTEASATSRGSITYNRGAGLTAYNTTSDYRAKDIIGPVTDSGVLIDSVPVYMGKMKGATQERPMFIAHEVPDYAHTGEKDAVDADGKPVYQQMDASALIPVMWAEIQSLRARVAALEGAQP